MSDEASQLEQLIADILQAEEAGRPLDREQLLREHPQLADELRLFLADHDRIREASRGGDDEPTWLDLRGSTMLGPGALFGDYELQEELGRGGMGVVFRARRRSLDKAVALKTLLPGALQDRSAVRRFYAEAEAAARLDHPGIVPVYDVGEVEGRHFYSMALVEGETLAQRAARDPLTPHDAAEIIRRIALAVQHAHDMGVIHRDLKPSNILLDAAGQPRIADFGLAKRAHAQGLTLTGQILGTLAYMPPEQAAGRHDQIDARADVYSLGAVLYSLLARRPPFQAESQAELIMRVLTSEPEHPRQVNPKCPRDLASICLRCLEKDPRQRYQTALELADDLDRFLQGQPIQSVPGGVVQRVRRWGRRQPALAAHLGAIASLELLRHSKHLFGYQPSGGWQQEMRISSILWTSALMCVGFQWLLSKTEVLGRFVWCAADLVFLTLILAQVDDPHGPLLAAYPMTIVFCGLLYRVRLVVFTTLASIVAYLTLLLARPPTTPPHYCVLFVVFLLVFGLVVGLHVRRLRVLDQYYRRGGGGGGSRREE